MWSMRGSRDEAWEELRLRDQGHAGCSCEETMKVKATMIPEGTGLSYVVYTGDVQYWRYSTRDGRVLKTSQEELMA